MPAPSPAPAPAQVAAAPAPVTPAASGPRLKLDPIDLSPGRNPGLKLNTELQNPAGGTEAERKAATELWAALNTPPDKAAEDGRRVAAMEADLKALREQQAALQASVAALTTQLQAERDERAPRSLVYALVAALALVAAALAWLVAERRRQRQVQSVAGDGPWWQSAQPSGSAGATDAAGAAAPAVANLAASTAAPAAVTTPAAVAEFASGDSGLAALQVAEATESSFAQLADETPVSVDALLDLVQQVEFFESLQQHGEVAMVLEQFIAEHPTASELPYLLMLRQAQQRDDAQALSDWRARFEQAFGVPAPAASSFGEGAAGLESQGKFMDVLARFWPGEQALGLLRNTLLAPPGTGLLEQRSLPAFEDALLLYSVAHTLAHDDSLQAPVASVSPAAEVGGISAGAVAGVAAASGAWAAASPAQAFVPPAPAVAPDVAPANGLDLDLSFAIEHDIPPSAPAPEPDEAAQRRELPMLDFDLFALDEGKPGEPPTKS